MRATAERRRVRGKGASPSGRFLIQALFPDATIPSPHADGQNRRKGQEAGETEPALCLVVGVWRWNRRVGKERLDQESAEGQSQTR